MPLKAQAISKRSDSTWVLKDVSFEAEPGEVVAVFGHSGSGKGPLLRILAGQDAPTSGEISVDGTTLSSVAKTEIDHLGRSANGGFMSRIFGSSAGSHLLSGHEIEAAASSGKRILILGSERSFADPYDQEAAFERIRSAARERQKYVLFATSSFDEVLYFSDKVAILAQGSMLQFGTPEDVYREPASAAVARLTGRCNLFEARRLSSSKAEVPEFQSISGEHRLTTGRIQRSRLGALNHNMTLGIRPEHVSISFGASFPEDNLLKAVVSDVKFLGPNTLVSLDAGGLQIEALVMRLVGLKSGDECMIGMPPDRIMAFTA